MAPELEACETGNKGNPDGGARFLNHVLADLCMKAANTEDLKKIKQIIEEAIEREKMFENGAPKVDPDAERLDRILDNLSDLSFTLFLIKNIFPSIRKEGMPHVGIAYCNAVELFWRKNTRESLTLEKDNRHFSLTNIFYDKYRERFEIFIDGCPYQIKLDHDSLFRNYDDKSIEIVKKYISTHCFKQEIFNWLKEQVIDFNKAYEAFKKQTDISYGVFHEIGMIKEAPTRMWEKVEKAKNTLLSLKDSFKKIEESIELIKRTKDAVGKESIHSTGLAKARENLEKIQKTKSELFENLLKAL